MGFIPVAVAMLTLLSAGRSAPVTDCESLIKPAMIQGRDQLLGKWTHIGESTNLLGFKHLTKMFFDSSWVKITAGEESDAISLFQAQTKYGHCFTLTTKMTLENGTLSMELPSIAVSEIKLTSGCSDCLVSYLKYTVGNHTFRSLQLMSRRNKVSAAELEEFNKQARCLYLPPPVIMDPEKGFCSDDPSTEKMEGIDLTNFMNDTNNTQRFSQPFETVFSSKDATDTIVEMYARRLAPVTGCESLIKPAVIQGRDQLLGKWTHIGESTNLLGFKHLTKMFFDSSWVKITAGEESDAISLFQAQTKFGRCFASTTNLTLENGRFSMKLPSIAVSEIKLTSGCSDCLVSYLKYTVGNRIFWGLQLMSRRNKVSAAELEEFNKQARCLYLPPPVIMDPEKGFCSGDPSTEKMVIIDLTDFMNDSNNTQAYTQPFETVFSSKTETDAIVEMIYSLLT